MFDDVICFINACPACKRYKKGKRARAPLRSFPLIGPWHMVGMDVVGPFSETKAGNKYALCVVDYFTKWPEAIAIPDQKTETLLSAVINNIVCRHGVPRIILSDQGPAFNSQKFKEECDILGAKQVFSPPYHQQSNGLVERCNQTLKIMSRRQRSFARPSGTST